MFLTKTELILGFFIKKIKVAKKQQLVFFIQKI